MTDILQLEGFFITKLHAEVVPPKQIPEDGFKLDANHDFNLTYDVAHLVDDETRYRMQLHLSLLPKEFGWKVESTIEGYFKCPDTWEPAMREGMIRVNGGTILYGLLRGQLAAFTGAFPPGAFLLPTVNMTEIVKLAEEAKGVTVITGEDEKPE